MIITDAQARAHLRLSIGEDDGNLLLYSDAAEQLAQQFMNRRVYPDAPLLAAAVAQAPVDLTAAVTAFESAVAVIDNLPCDQRQSAREFADSNLTTARNSYFEIMRGMVATELMVNAMLLILGHLYANREDVITGLRAAAVQIPMSSQYLLMPYRISMGV